MEEEIWKDIPGYEGYYQVSNMGRVKSLNRLKQCGCGFYEEPDILLKPKKAGPVDCMLVSIKMVSVTICTFTDLF